MNRKINYRKKQSLPSQASIAVVNENIRQKSYAFAHSRLEFQKRLFNFMSHPGVKGQ